MAAMFGNRSEQNQQYFKDRPQMLLIKFQFIWPSSFRGEDSQKLTNQKQELPIVAMFINGSEQNMQSLQRTFHIYFLLISSHLAKRFRSRRFLEIGQAFSEEIFMVAMFVEGQGRNQQSYRGPSIDASCQVSVHLIKWFQRRRFKCEKLTDDGRQVMAATSIR